MEKKPLWSIFAHIYRKIILPACFLHTIISFVMMLVSDFDAIKVSSAGLILLFSLAVSLSNQLFALKQMHILLRTTLHFICITVAFALVMLYGSGNFVKNSQGSMMILVVFVVLYLLIAPIPVYFMHRNEKKKEEKEEYQSIYRR